MTIRPALLPLVLALAALGGCSADPAEEHSGSAPPRLSPSGDPVEDASAPDEASPDEAPPGAEAPRPDEEPLHDDWHDVDAPAEEPAPPPDVLEPEDPSLDEGTAETAPVDEEPIAATAAGRQFVWPVPAWIAATERYYDGRNHSGSADLAAPYWTPVGAARGGTVKSSTWTKIGGWLVKIDHGDGYSTLYSHLTEEPIVDVGDVVETGQVIGYLGRTGNAYRDGAHVHFSIVKNGTRLAIPGITYGDWVDRGDYIPGDYGPLPSLSSRGEQRFDVKVVVPEVGVYASASQGSTRVASLEEGDVVTVVDSYRGYYEIESGSTTGWVVHTATAPLKSNLFSVRIKVGTANVRAAPSTSAEVVGTLSEGKVLTIFGTSASGSWYRFLYDLPTTYEWTAKSNTEPTVQFDARIRSRTANVRAGPGVDHPVVGELQIFDPIRVREVREGWYRITYEGQAAWVAGWLTQGRL